MDGHMDRQKANEVDKWKGREMDRLLIGKG